MVERKTGVPVVGLYQLIQDQHSFCEPALKGARGVASLCGQALCFGSDPGEMQLQLMVAEKILARVPLYPFHFRPEKDFWEALK
jgi:hypothetical protein